MTRPRYKIERLSEFYRRKKERKKTKNEQKYVEQNDFDDFQN